MSNTRAMQWKKSAEEYDRLLADISRLRRWIETEIATLVSRLPREKIPGGKQTWNREVEDLRIALQIDMSLKGIVDLGLEGSKVGERPSLDTLRIIHRNLDVVIDLAEECCADLGIGYLFARARSKYGFK